MRALHARVASIAVLVAVLAGATACSSSTPRADRSRSAHSPVDGSRTPTRTAAYPPAPPSSPASSRPAIPVASITAAAGPSGGVVLERSIPSSGGFRPRPAYLYVPPILRRHPAQQVPVLELLHGTPGAPSDWFVKGSLRATADAFARAHGGMAPLVVVPDINGAQHADSECIRTATGGNVETYLTRDVVSWVRTHYAKAVGTARWWVAGLSEGGLCSAMLALRHPDLYAAFGDLSGLLAPRVEHVTAAQSDLQLYGGNATARREHQPLWLLQHRRYADLRGWFTSGASDTRVLAAQRTLLAAARAAGLPTHAQLLPGRHTWTVWSTGLRDLMPWLWAARPR